MGFHLPVVLYDGCISFSGLHNSRTIKDSIHGWQRYGWFYWTGRKLQWRIRLGLGAAFNDSLVACMLRQYGIGSLRTMVNLRKSSSRYALCTLMDRLCGHLMWLKGIRVQIWQFADSGAGVVTDDWSIEWRESRHCWVRRLWSGVSGLKVHDSIRVKMMLLKQNPDFPL